MFLIYISMVNRPGTIHDRRRLTEVMGRCIQRNTEVEIFFVTHSSSCFVIVQIHQCFLTIVIFFGIDEVSTELLTKVNILEKKEDTFRYLLLKKANFFSNILAVVVDIIEKKLFRTLCSEYLSPKIPTHNKYLLN